MGRSGSPGNQGLSPDSFRSNRRQRKPRAAQCLESSTQSRAGPTWSSLTPLTITISGPRAELTGSLNTPNIFRDPSSITLSRTESASDLIATTASRAGVGAENEVRLDGAVVSHARSFSIVSTGCCEEDNSASSMGPCSDVVIQLTVSESQR